VLTSACSTIEEAFEDPADDVPSSSTTTPDGDATSGVGIPPVPGTGTEAENTEVDPAAEACEADIPRDSGGDNVLDIGAILPETGDLSFLSKSTISAARLAVCQINQAGGVRGELVTLRNLDSGTNAEINEVAFTQLLSEDRDLIVGPASPLLTMNVVEQLANTETLGCNPTSASSYLTAAPDSGFLFRTMPTDRLQGAALADLVAEDDNESVALLHRDDAPGALMADAFEARLGSEAPDIEFLRIPFDPAKTGFDVEVDQVAEAAPDAVAILALPTNGVGVLTTLFARDINTENTGIYVTDGLQSDGLYRRINEERPELTDGIKGTAPSPDPDPVGAFADDLDVTAPGNNRAFSAQVFDCITSVAVTAQAIDSVDPVAIKDGLIDTTTGGRKCRTFQRCAELIAEGTDIDYDGPSGAIELDQAGDPQSGTFDIFSYRADGTYEVDGSITLTVATPDITDGVVASGDDQTADPSAEGDPGEGEGDPGEGEGEAGEAPAPPTTVAEDING